MRKVLLLTVVLAFAFASAAGAAAIDGNWAVKMKSPQGEDENFTIAIKAAGENLTITSSDHPKLTNLEGTGTLKGDAITMNLKATGQMAVEFAFTGTVAGNKMTGTREITVAQGGAPGGEGGGERGAAPGGEGAAAPEGERGAAPGGEGAAAPEGERGAPPGGENSAASAESAESGGPGGAPGEAQGEVSDAFTAEKI